MPGEATFEWSDSILGRSFRCTGCGVVFHQIFKGDIRWDDRIKLRDGIVAAWGDHVLSCTHTRVDGKAWQFAEGVKEVGKSMEEAKKTALHLSQVFQRFNPPQKSGPTPEEIEEKRKRDRIEQRAKQGIRFLRLKGKGEGQ